MGQPGFVNLRVATPSVLKVLSKDKINSILEKNQQLSNIFNKYKLKIVKESSTKPVPLDYIMALPKKITDPILKQTRKKLMQTKIDEINERTNTILQNLKDSKGVEM